MDPGDELRLREIQREYLDFLDDDVSFYELNENMIQEKLF